MCVILQRQDVIKYIIASNVRRPKSIMTKRRSGGTMINGNILVIPDLHIPFEHKHALEFCAKKRDEYNCDIVTSIGDLFDFHALSDYVHDPDGFTSGHELSEAEAHVIPWILEFKKMFLCIGNHDARLARKAFESGISARYIRNINEIFGLPDSWVWKKSWIAHDIVFQHGIYSGKDAGLKSAINNRQSTVTGHAHAFAGIQWSSSPRDLIYGFNVGCLVDMHSYAMQYSQTPNRPVLGCGVILDQGRLPIFETLNLGTKIIYKE